MIIPVERLEAQTLEQVIREWLMRQGEDWGLEEGSLDAAIERARLALAKGRLVLYWDANEEYLTLVDPRTLPHDASNNDEETDERDRHE